MKSIRRWFFDWKLDKIFKKAEQLMDQGVEKGNPQYASLYTEVQNTVSSFKRHVPDFDPKEIPAIEILRNQTIPQQKMSKPMMLSIVGLSLFALVQVVGISVAAAQASIHMWQHLFQWIGL